MTGLIVLTVRRRDHSAAVLLTTAMDCIGGPNARDVKALTLALRHQALLTNGKAAVNHDI